MTIDLDEEPDADVLRHLSNLRCPDVSSSRARRLRRQCHAILQPEPRATRSARSDLAPVRDVVVPAIGALWCLAYLAEIIRSTAAVYAYFGTAL